MPESELSSGFQCVLAFVVLEWVSG